ncbi:FliM/FliN family flagellar motor switch protein [Duganella sp. CT11-72]|uniref:FliM/FliN family flagellar motor switch protein n=1 Tax=Duganella sp. CT11-72 TaxID=3243052 RepID=UPI0039AFAA2C
MPSSPIILSSPAHALRPLAVASISREQADLARQIGSGRQAALPALAPDALLTLQAASDAAPSWLEPLSVQGSFGRIELVRGARLLRALTGIDLGDDNHGPQWEWLQAAVCARLHGTPLAGADSLAQGQLAVAAPGLVTLRLTLRGACHLITTHGRASAADWLRLLAGGDWLRLQSPFDGYAGLPLHLPLRLARHRLPRAMLAGLRPGDVLLPDGSAFDRSGQGHVTLGGLRATVRYQAPASLIILALETQMDAPHDMAQDLPQPAAAPDMLERPLDGVPAVPAAALDQLPATLDIELGKLTLSLGALRGLAAGSTLLLAGADPAALEIRCAGRLLGRGEAVDVDGRLGVRITEWSAA